jgi:hypothetical protein
MGIPYSEKKYLYPPRAEHAVTPSFLKHYEGMNFVAQFKKNGTNSVIFVGPDRIPSAMGRQNNEHKQWRFTEGSAEVFRKIPGKGWYVFNAELMHSKTKGLKDHNYIHDVLVADGEWLVGTTYQDRYDRLIKLFKPDVEIAGQYCLNQHTSIAVNYKKDFERIFENLQGDENEGLVLKNPEGKYSPTNNDSWLVKCRKLHKNFSF